MGDPERPGRPVPPLRELLAMLLAAAAAAALALAGVVGWGLALPASLAGFAVTLGLRWLRPRVGLVAVLPGLASLGFAVAVARASIVTELLGAASAIALLVATAREPAEPAPPARAGSTVLPVIAVLAALAASLLLPPSPAQVGLAAAVLVGTFLLLTVLYASPGVLGAGDPSRS